MDRHRGGAQHFLGNQRYDLPTITTDGEQVFAVVATDTSGNQGSREVAFAIDRLAPEIEISGVSDGQVTSAR